MRKKILVSISLLFSCLILIAPAQQFSLYEAKKMKEGRAVLKSRPHLWFGKANNYEKSTIAEGSESLSYGKKKACQFAAIKALAELQKKATQEKAIIVKNIHSPSSKPGFYYCNISGSSASVKLRGTFANK